MNLLIIGCAGFIGTNISLLALSKGHKVIGLDALVRMGVKENLKILKQNKRFVFFSGDVRSLDDFASIPRNIDIIVNLAANPSVPRSIKDPMLDFQINAVGHLNVLEFSRTHGRIPIIFSSSSRVYSDSIITGMKEKKTRYVVEDPLFACGFNEHSFSGDPDRPTRSPYGISKFMAEEYTRAYGRYYNIPYVVNRMGCVYGLYQKGVEEQGWVDWFLRAKKDNTPIVVYGNGKQVRDLVFGSDIAELYLYEVEHMDKMQGNTFVAGGGIGKGFNTSVIEMILLINDLFPGRPLSYSFAPERPGDQRWFVSDIRKVSKTTGWRPSTLIVEGLRRMWRHY